MNLTQLLLKGTADDIASSPLAKGIGPKGAADIVNARNNTTNVLDLLQEGTNKRSVQDTLFETLATEESATFQAGRSSVADMLRQRSQDETVRAHPSGAYVPTPMRLLEYDPTVQTTRVQGGAIPLGGIDGGDVVKDIKGNTFIDKGFDQRRLAEQELNRMDEGMASIYDEVMGLPQVKSGQKLKKGEFGDTSDMRGYDEAGHMRSNNATSTNAMNGNTKGPTPPSSSNMPVNANTTATGSTNYSGYYQPGETPSSSGLLGSMSQDGAAGVMSSVAFGAAIGGAANYAMGGEFGEGAMMGGIAGGGIKIGARAIQQNQASIENFLQRTALGAESYTEGMSRDTAAGAIQGMSAAPEGAGLMQKGAFNMLKSESPSLGMQSRYMVMGGSALAGVTFTGNRKDKRRGFNAHRGNRI